MEGLGLGGVQLHWCITTDPVMSFQHHLSSAGPFELLMSEPLEANLITIISTQMEFHWLKRTMQVLTPGLLANHISGLPMHRGVATGGKDLT